MKTEQIEEVKETQEEIQNTFNEDSIEELVEDGSVENADENDLPEQ